MGSPMAGHLLNAGYTLYIHSRSKLPDELVEGGANVCANAQEVAKRADIVFLMLPDTPDVEKVLFGEQGVVAGLGKGKTVVDCSSIDPIMTRSFATRLKSLGCDYADAPVSGGQLGAKAASLIIMVGADAQVFDRINLS